MYEKYYLEDGKTSKCMVMKITNNCVVDKIRCVLHDHKIRGYITSDAHIHVRVGKGKNSHKAQVCKDLGFRYVDPRYWLEEAYPNNKVTSLRGLGV